MRRSGVVLTVGITMALVITAIVLWMTQTGRLALFADGTTHAVSVTVQSGGDWQKGDFQNLKFVDGALRFASASESTPAPASPTATPAGTSVKTIDQAGAVQLYAKTSGYCKYNAPEDWAAVTDDSGAGIDILKSNYSMYAGWSIWPVDRAAEQYYGPQFGDPDASNLALINQLLTGGGYRADARYTGPNELVMRGLFTVRSWQSSQKTGVIIYHIYPNPDISRAYISSRYVAATDSAKWAKDGGTAVAVAISIRCTSQLRPSSSAGTTGSGGARDQADGISGSDYNAQLGTETVHDPDTGQNYTVDHATGYNQTGPQGPGYYKANGNDVKKLETGMVY